MNKRKLVYLRKMFSTTSALASLLSQCYSVIDNGEARKTTTGDSSLLASNNQQLLLNEDPLSTPCLGLIARKPALHFLTAVCSLPSA